MGSRVGGSGTGGGGLGGVRGSGERVQLPVPEAVVEIARRLEEAGCETWAVGGAVRDALLGLPVGDWDLTTRARPEEVRRLFRRTVPIGIEHGTVGVFGRDGVLYEVTTFRRDIETFGRHAVVAFADTVDEDLSRRDFTCNALAWHPLTGELRDPYLGLQDLEERRLRTVGSPSERFAEDYLRVLRALRFAGHFELTIDPPTWDALVEATPRLIDLSAERVREELWKIFTKTRRASAALSLYAASGSLAVLYPELERLVGLEPVARSTRGPSRSWPSTRSRRAGRSCGWPRSCTRSGCLARVPATCAAGGGSWATRSRARASPRR